MRRIVLLFILMPFFVHSQNQPEGTSVEVNFLRGNVLPHTDDLNHLITGHPEGVMINFLKKTRGSEEWQKLYNYPDYGAFLLVQDFKNEILGKSFSAGIQYNFYFFKRNVQFKISQGIAFSTNPHNKETNSKNNAFGSAIMGNTNFGLVFKKENIINNFGFQASLLFTHFSNGRIKAPNSGINTANIGLGINYNLDKEFTPVKDSIPVSKKFTEPVKYNFVLRTGVNESPIINSGQHTFYHIGVYADKRINKKSALQLGTELFISNYFKDFIKYQSVAYPEQNLDPNTDFKRVGIFIGHELFINKLSLEAQLGYYVYQPYDFDIPVYDRVGAKYYFNKKIFTGVSIKTHGFLAEAMEFIIGIRI